MIHISLPYFYQNYKFNNFFKNYIYDKEKLKMNINIEFAHGVFPWSYWNGGVNNHSGNAVLVPEMEQLINSTLIPLRLDWSNYYLTTDDLNDCHSNAIIKILQGTNTTYEISNLEIMKYIELQDKYSSFIISNNAQMIAPFTEEIINLFSSQNNINLISINNILDFDINKINKEKIEVNIGFCSNCSIEQQLQCSVLEHNNIYNFSENSIYTGCNQKKFIINYLDEISFYTKLGINHFKINVNPLDLSDFNINIITSFIKTEYVGECINEYYKFISK